MDYSLFALEVNVEGGANSLTSISTLFSEFTGWMGDIVTTMTAEGNELMLIPVGIFVVGAVIGLASRLIGR